uniref:Uncharacterized protein n=1 Tax=Monopterus albus TaxID=43700 RepID=A0A3Q3QA52_MONAL
MKCIKLFLVLSLVAVMVEPGEGFIHWAALHGKKKSFKFYGGIKNRYGDQQENQD